MLRPDLDQPLPTSAQGVFQSIEHRKIQANATQGQSVLSSAHAWTITVVIVP